MPVHIYYRYISILYAFWFESQSKLQADTMIQLVANFLQPEMGNSSFCSAVYNNYTCRLISKLATHNIGISWAPGIVTDGPPSIVQTHLHCTLIVCNSSY